VSEPVPQRLTIVLPSTGAFDSRTYRIASGMVERGHAVTVLARAGPGLSSDELVDAGYRVVRVPVSALRGLPLPGRLIGAIERRRASRRSPSEVTAAGTGGDPGADARAQAEPTGRRRSGRLGRAWDSGLRLVRIWLTVRSQTRASRSVDRGADLYHGMAYMGIPVALALGHRHRSGVVYDARDIYLEARNLARLPRPARWLFGRAERGWARRSDRVATVNAAYAAVMADRFGVEPFVVMNCSYRREAPPEGDRPRRFHEALGLSAQARIVLYHGGLAPDRGIEQLVAALPGLDPSTHLVFLGYGPLEPWIAALVGQPPTGGRIHLLPAVPPAALIGWVASADVVAMPIQPSTLNHRLTTPNKLFEALTAGAPVVAADLPGMATIVRETGCGVLCDPTDAAAVATAIRTVLDAPPEVYASYRRAARTAAVERYSWEAQLEVLAAEYARLTGRPW
jgi:glycosyltransferase involved in cell wall biosynthesis